MKNVYATVFSVLCFCILVSLSSCKGKNGTGEGIEVSNPEKIFEELMGLNSSQALQICGVNVYQSDILAFLNTCFQNENRVSYTFITPHGEDWTFAKEYSQMSKDEEFVWFKTFPSGFTRWHTPSEGEYLAEGYIVTKINPQTNKTFIVRLFAKKL